MHNVSLTASPVRKNKHTTPGTQKLENAQVHKSEIFLWGVFVFVISYNNPSQEPDAFRDGSRRTGPAAASKSTEDSRPHISAISACPS